MSEISKLWNVSEQSSKQSWSSVEQSTENLKAKLSAHHRRAIDEIEVADTDYYEDNIYDEPEYWRSGHYFLAGEKKHRAGQ